MQGATQNEVHLECPIFREIADGVLTQVRVGIWSGALNAEQNSFRCPWLGADSGGNLPS